MNEIYAVAAMAERDLMKFLRDRTRLISTFVLPFLLIGVLGGSLQMNLGRSVGFNFVGFTFTGVLGMTIFQSTASGMAWLAEDRFNDFAQEIFVSPVSRYSIVFGKILGESLVALAQVAPLVVFGLILRVALTPTQIALIIPVAIISCFLGGSFGLVSMTMIQDQRAANQIFQFLILPQFFLAGVFNPIGILPWYLELLSRISPLRYVVDLIRDVVYAGHPEYHQVVLLSPATNLLVVAAMFGGFMIVGTLLFVRHETNR